MRLPRSLRSLAIDKEKKVALNNQWITHLGHCERAAPLRSLQWTRNSKLLQWIRKRISLCICFSCNYNGNYVLVTAKSAAGRLWQSHPIIPTVFIFIFSTENHPSLIPTLFVLYQPKFLPPSCHCDVALLPTISYSGSHILYYPQEFSPKTDI